jgi:hypothetical protein
MGSNVMYLIGIPNSLIFFRSSSSIAHIKVQEGNILFEVLRTMFMWFLAAFCKLGMLG